jgi:hypothetical protein
LAVGEELGYLGTLELAPLDFARLGIHDMELEDIFGNIHSNDGQLCGRFHGGTSRFEVVATNNLHSGTLMPLLRGPPMMWVIASRQQQ